MPELPEVTTTVRGLNEVLPGLTIRDVWTDYHIRASKPRKHTVKHRPFFASFKKEVIGEKVKKAERRGKNILIHLTHGKTILIHMKMTGHLLYGTYAWDGKKWKSNDPFLSDPFNQFIHFVCTLSNGRHLAFSDVRKFATVTLFETDKRNDIPELARLGPEPLDHLSLKTFAERLNRKPKGKIKTVLMDQSVIAGIGNIYSDEILWDSGIHPERKVSDISAAEMKKMWASMKKILAIGIRLGGDSMSDYRNIRGERGNFQKSHKAYRRAKQPCPKKGCTGIITRKVIGGRSAHFCNKHQK